MTRGRLEAFNDAMIAIVMTRRPLVRRSAIVLLAIAAGLVIGFGIHTLRMGGLAGQVVAPPYDALGGVVEVDGRGVYLDCLGSGEPTVLLEAGFTSGAAGWGAVLDGIAGFTRVCAWDRPGIGRSDPRALHTAGETAANLRAALHAVGEVGPFVVVAHSLGGVYARIFSDGPVIDGEPDRSRDAAIQFVMLDTYEPDLGLVDDPALAPDIRARIAESLSSTGASLQAGEQLDWARTLDELDRGGTVEQPGVLLMVDPRLRLGDQDPARQAAIIDAWYRGIAARYPYAALEIVADTGHMVHLERPGLVIDRVRSIVLAARRLP